MKLWIKIILIIAASATVLGLAIGIGGLCMINFDFEELQTQTYEPVTHEVTGEFSDISIQTYESSIEFKQSFDGTCKIECMESEHLTYDVKVQDGKLSVTARDTRQWYHNIGIFNLQRQNMTVYLPDTVYGKLQIQSATGSVHTSPEFSFADVEIDLNTGLVSWEANVAHSMKIENRTGMVQIKNVTLDGALSVDNATGSISIEGVQAQSLKAKTSTGKVGINNTSAEEEIRISTNTGYTELNGCRAADISIEGNTGKVRVCDVEVTDRLQIETDTGDVELDACLAGEMQIDTDTGDVEGTLASPMVIFARSDTGRIRIPKSTTGGRCDITTDTGNIIIEFEE